MKDPWNDWDAATREAVVFHLRHHIVRLARDADLAVGLPTMIADYGNLVRALGDLCEAMGYPMPKKEGM